MMPEQRRTQAVSELPALYCPFPSFVHPQADRIDKKASEWMSSCPIPQDPDDRRLLLRSGLSRLLSNSCARGNADRLEVGSKWIYLGFSYDDWFESHTSLDGIVNAVCAMQRAQEAPGSVLSDVPFLPAFAEIMGDLRGIATPTQYKRFTYQHLSYLHAIPWEASYRLRREVPDLNTDVILRLNAGANLPFLAIMEICNGEEVPSAEFNHPTCQAAVEVAALLLSWVNDLCSISKDSRDGGGRGGIVNSLQRERRYSLEEAVMETISVWNRSMFLFKKLSVQLATHGSPHLRRFLDDCGASIRAIIDVHAENPRYDSPALSVTADPPADLDPSPLNIPSISWWWQQLA
ncbi:terpene synthase family protein [Streptomyces sp. NPDC102365]|uniref:terpene synthase family protein n=1 Tax=Streptomyces sp. NPDC102365 TaxID=3366162 RepID=UPI003801AF2E